MSGESKDCTLTGVRKMPRFIVRKDRLTNLTILKPGSSELLKRLTTLSKPTYREEVIYTSESGDFLKLTNKLTLLNKQNLANNSILTAARYEEDGRVVKELTSENVTNLIGKENYDLVFSTLCSVISQEFKIRAILALLTAPKKPGLDTNSTEKTKILKEATVQTEETNIDYMMRLQPRRRVRKQQPAPYVVTDVPEKRKRVVINPSDFKHFSKPSQVTVKTEQSDDNQMVLTPTYPLDNMQVSQLVTCSNEELALDVNEDSKDSLSGFSIATTSDIMNAPLKMIDRSIERQPLLQPGWDLTTIDGTVIHLPVKPEDDFHIATPEILKQVKPDHRRKLLYHQLYIDWQLCLKRNDEENLAIHEAVISGDVDLVRRQCLVLRSKEETVDVPTGNNMTALQLSITRGSAACTALLLRFGADPLAADDEYRTCFHLAAEAAAAHLPELVAHCRSNPLRILQENEEFWKPELASKPTEYLASYLLNEICSMYDNQGDTPLMVAARLGRPAAVLALAKAAPRAVNMRSSSCGNTALHAAVSAACHDALNRGNKSKISDDFKRTIEILIDNDADPTIANDADFDVNSLLSNSGNNELSMLVAAKLSYMNTRDTTIKAFKPTMLIKEEDGTVNTVDLSEQLVKRVKKEPVKKETTKNTGKVIKNIKEPVKNTRQGNKNTPKNVKKMMEAALSNTDKKINMIEINEIVVNKTVETPNTSAQNIKSSKEDKLVILENKMIKPESVNKTQTEPASSNQYLNHFKNFVDNRSVWIANKMEGKAPKLKRKNDEAKVEIAVDNVETLVKHPRVQTLRKIPAPKIPADTTSDVIQNDKKTIDTKVVKIVNYARDTTGEVANVVNSEASNSKV